MKAGWDGARRPSADLAGRRVMIVEDEVIVAFCMECEIEDAGGIVVGPVYSVAEALGIIDSVDVAVLDININGEQIWPVADALSARGVPFVLASANCGDPNAIPLAYAGVARFDKPVAMDRLVAKISELATSGLRASETAA